MHDIKKTKEELLLELAQLYEGLSVGLYRTTPDGTIILANPALVKMLGYSSFEELTAFNLEQKSHEQNFERKPFIEQMEKYGEVKGLESKWYRSDGRSIIVKESAKIVRGDDGNVIYYDGSVEDITESKLIEETQMFLINSFNEDEKDNFFTSLATYLAKCLDMDYVCIDKLHHSNLAAQTLAIYFDGKFNDNVEYTLKETPCGDVVGKNICCFPQKVRHLFPNDVVLQEMNAESYIGTTLWSSDHHPIGLIAVIGRKPLENHHLAETILKLVAIRTASEIERKQSAEMLRENEVKLKAILESTADGILAIDDKGKIIKTNQRFIDLWHIPKILMDSGDDNALLNFVMEQLINGNDFVSKVQKLYGTKEEDLDILNFKDGRIFERFSVPLILNETSIGRVWSFRDITERKRMEDKLKEDEQNYRTLADSGRAMIWLSGTDKLCYYFNKVWLEFTGRTLDQETGNGWAEGVHPDDFQYCLKIYVEAFDRHEDFSMEYRLLHHSGEYRWILDDGSPRYDSNGNFIGYIGHCLDINDRKLAEEELTNYRSHLEELVGLRTEELKKANLELASKIEKENEVKITLQKSLEKEKQLNEMKSIFITTTSHEFRTPLATILSSAEMIQKYSTRWDEKKKTEHLVKIQNSVVHLTKLMDDILNIGRTEKESYSFNPEPLDLLSLVQNCIEESKSFVTMDHRVLLKYFPDQTEFSLDSTLLNFILNNLLSNAIKYSPDGGKVELIISTDLGGLLFEVKDEGVGIPEEEYENIFETFYRTKTSRVIPGNGLGLAIVKRAVDLHNGEITVESEFGKGTTFKVKIPINAEMK